MKSRTKRKKHRKERKQDRKLKSEDVGVLKLKCHDVVGENSVTAHPKTVIDESQAPSIDSIEIEETQKYANNQIASLLPVSGD